MVTSTSAFLPQDRKFRDFKDKAPDKYPPSRELRRLRRASVDRKDFSIHNDTKFNEHWSTSMDFNYVSDDYYFQDFGGSFLASSTNQLLRQIKLRYNSRHWESEAHVEGYQTLHPVNQSATTKPFSRSPELMLNGSYPDLPFKFGFDINNEAVRFTGGEASKPRGDRINVHAIFTRPFNWVFGYIKPKIELQGTTYSLSNIPDSADSYPHRFAPYYSVDTGLFFERQTSFFNQDYLQTLEPRAFYLYVPYHSQNDIPVFDSSLQTFSFEQMFPYEPL